MYPTINKVSKKSMMVVVVSVLREGLLMNLRKPYKFLADVENELESSRGGGISTYHLTGTCHFAR